MHSVLLYPGVTILLSLTVFLNMVAETMPATSDAVPLLGTYFNCIMFMVASSVVSTILILNYHHRHADTHEMSDWVRIDQIFLRTLKCFRKFVSIMSSCLSRFDACSCTGYRGCCACPGRAPPRRPRRRACLRRPT